MLIRYGYEIAINCAQPTPVVCLLSVSLKYSGLALQPHEVEGRALRAPKSKYRQQQAVQ